MLIKTLKELGIGENEVKEILKLFEETSEGIKDARELASKVHQVLADSGNLMATLIKNIFLFVSVLSSISHIRFIFLLQNNF